STTRRDSAAESGAGFRASAAAPRPAPLRKVLRPVGNMASLREVGQSGPIVAHGRAGCNKGMATKNTKSHERKNPRSDLPPPVSSGASFSCLFVFFVAIRGGTAREQGPPGSFGDSVLVARPVRPGLLRRSGRGPAGAAQRRLPPHR